MARHNWANWSFKFSTKTNSPFPENTDWKACMPTVNDRFYLIRLKRKACVKFIFLRNKCPLFCIMTQKWMKILMSLEKWMYFLLCDTTLTLKVLLSFYHFMYFKFLRRFSNSTHFKSNVPQYAQRNDSRIFWMISLLRFVLNLH